MDFSIKPSLSVYDFRPDTFDLKRPTTSLSTSGLNSAKDNDEAFLALVDRQNQVAASKMKSGEHKQAVALLRRSYSLALSHNAPAPGSGRPLVVKLALACVRLNLCAAQSQLGRHAQALEEASEAKRELEELWNSLTGATLDMTIADQTGDSSRPHPVLRGHITQPPSWLERAIGCSIQARLCMAVEMEYILPDDQFQVALDAACAMDEGRPMQKLKPKRSGSKSLLGGNSVASKGSRPSSRAGGTNQGGSADDVESMVLHTTGMPLPPLATGQELQQLYYESLRLAVQLLPPGHAVWREAMTREQEARERWRQASQINASRSEVFASHSGQDSGSALYADGEERPALEHLLDGHEQGDFDVAETTDQSPQLPLPPLSRTPKTGSRRLRPSMQNSTSRSMSSLGAGTASGFLSEPSEDSPAPSQMQPAMMETLTSPASSAAEWVRTSPPGDVYFRSLPWSFASSGGGSTSGLGPKPKKKKKKQSASDASPKPAITAQEPVDPDPFKDWQKNYMNVGSMSLFQRKLLSLEGISSLHKDMKDESKRFRHFMQDLAATHDSETRLSDDRIKFTDHGAKADAVRKKAWHVSERGQKLAESEKELFDYYGLSKHYESGLSAKSLRLLMQESFERSPAEQKRKKDEEARRKAREQEEAERRRRSLAAAFGSKK